MQTINIRSNSAANDGFTACTRVFSLLETIDEAEKIGAGDGLIFLSPICSSFDRFQNLRQRGERILPAMKSISWGGADSSPKMHGETRDRDHRLKSLNGKYNFSFRGFLRENHEANQPIKSTSQKGRACASNEYE